MSESKRKLKVSLSKFHNNENGQKFLLASVLIVRFVSTILVITTSNLFIFFFLLLLFFVKACCVKTNRENSASQMWNNVLRRWWWWWWWIWTGTSFWVKCFKELFQWWCKNWSYYIRMSQISSRNLGSFLFFSLREKHFSLLALPRLLSSVRTERSFANITFSLDLLLFT